MTEYFEVHERDGPARRGEVRLADPLVTPALADDVLADAGSLWPTDREAPEGDESALTILPHRAFPAGTADEVADAFAVDYPTVDYPNAVVVSTATAEDHGADAYVLSDVRGAVGHGAAVAETVVAVRDAIPADSALLFPGVATPANVATLAWAGADLFDADRAAVAGTRGRYLTTEGEYDLAALDELPCSCPACRTPRESFTREDCAAHNENALRAELARVRRRIRDGRLRDYVEGQARHEQWLTATVRELDDRWEYVERAAPVLREAEMVAATEDTLRRAEVQRFADRVTSRYRNRFDNPLVLVPCSAVKPYGESKSHGRFHDAVQYRAHLVSLSSPVGVVPQELECTYPAQHYDAVVTGRWSATETEFVAGVLRAYLRRTDYPRVVAHVAGGYRTVVERAVADLDDAPPVEYTVEDHPTDDDAVANLTATLSGELKYSRREREHNTVRAIADYMLGDGAGDDLFAGDVRTTSRYPKLQVRDADGEQLAAMVPRYGVLAFTLAGARRWVESDAPTKRVDIDGFVPHGSVLAPGVVGADDGIRVGDEVVVEGPAAFAVGRAAMAGPEMAESTRGIAVEVRHVEER